jgi:hypothetical protein
MHEKKIESIINRLSNIINNTPDVLPNENLANQRLFNRDETSFYLIGDNLDVYNTLLEDLLLKERWDKKFSEKYVDSVLQDEIFNILKYGVRKAIESFSKTCN